LHFFKENEEKEQKTQKKETDFTMRKKKKHSMHGFNFSLINAVSPVKKQKRQEISVIPSSIGEKMVFSSLFSIRDASHVTRYGETNSILHVVYVAIR